MRRITAIVLGFVAATSGCAKLSAGSPSSKRSAAAAAAAITPAEPTPIIRITTPARGAFLATGRAAVEGRVQGVSNTAVVDVRLNGQPVSADASGTFRGSVDVVEGLNVLEAAATDAKGRTGTTAVGVMGGAYKPLSSPVAHATLARINNPALDACGKIAEAAIWQQDWTQILKGLGWVKGTSWLFITVWVQVDQVRFRDVHATIASRTGGAKPTITVDEPKLDVTLYADLSIGRVGPFAALVEADSATVDVTASLAPRRDGTIACSTSSPTTTFNNLRINISNGILDAAIQLLAKNTLANKIRDYANGALTTDLPQFLEASLAEFLQQAQPWSIGGKPLAIDVRGEQVAFDDQGVTLEVSFNANGGQSQQLTPRGAAAPGSLSTAGAQPNSFPNRGFFVCSDDDAMNRFFHVMWATGGFDVEMDEAFLQQNNVSLPMSLDVASFKRFLPEIGGVIPDAAPIKIRIEAGLPPVLRASGRPDAAILQAGEFAVDLMVDRGNGWEKLLRSVVHTEIGGNLTLTSQGVQVSSLSTPRFRFDIIESPIIPIDTRRTEVLLSVMLTPTVPHMLNSMNVIPVPYLNQLTTFNVDIYPEGPAVEHLAIAGDMAR